MIYLTLLALFVLSELITGSAVDSIEPVDEREATDWSFDGRPVLYIDLPVGEYSEQPLGAGDIFPVKRETRR